MTSKMNRLALTALLAALCAVTAAYPAPAQEGAAAGGDAAQAPASDVEPFTPQRGPAGLLRRANLKGLIANAPGKAASIPPAMTRTAPLLARSNTVAVQRNAIGVALPGTPTPPRSMTGATAPVEYRPANTVTPVANVAHLTQRPPTLTAGVQHTTGINGTTMGRAGLSLIGGPAKDHSGINGTSMRQNH